MFIAFQTLYSFSSSESEGSLHINDETTPSPSSRQVTKSAGRRYKDDDPEWKEYKDGEYGKCYKCFVIAAAVVVVVVFYGLLLLFIVLLFLFLLLLFCSKIWFSLVYPNLVDEADNLASEREMGSCQKRVDEADTLWKPQGN